MRKLHHTIPFLAAALLALAAACVPVDLTPLRPDVPDIPGFEDVEFEDHCILLRLDPTTARMVKTKARDTERGVDDLNENKVNTIDCFFYKTGETDQPAIFRAIGRTVEERTELPDSTECYVKVYYNDDIAEVLFGDTKQGTCEAFVIANAAINYPASPTVDDLRQSTLEYDFSQQEKQPYFTMCSQETAQVTLYTIPNPEYPNDRTKDISTAAGRVPLYRCAAKAQIFLKLPETLKDVQDGKVYAPRPNELGGIQVRLSTGVKKTYADWDYTVTTLDYIHFADRTMTKLTGAAQDPVDLVDGKEDYNYGHIPFYSYPMSWTDLDDNAANFIFSIPWALVIYGDDGKTITGYGEPERRYYKLSANVIGRKFEANGFYRTLVYVQNRGEKDLDQAVEIDNCYYVITPWVHEGLQTTSGESISGEFVRYKFLVVEPDDVTLNNESKYTFNFSSSADLLNSKVIIDRVEFKKYNTGVAVNKSISINDSQSSVNNRNANHAQFIDPNEYKVTYNYRDGEIYFEHKLNDVYEERDIYLTVTNRDGMSQTVKIHQKPAIMVNLNSDTKVRDVFVDGFFCMVRNATFGSSRTVSYNSSPGPSWSGTYFYSPSGTGGSNPGEDLNVGTVSGNNYTNYGTITRGTRTNENPIYTLEISVSAFTADNHTYKYSDNSGQGSREYRIADPRVRAGDVYNNWSVFPYVLNRPNGNYAPVAWDHPEDILITTQALDKQNYIAPKFLVSSTMNGQSQKPGFNNAVKRGAVYQEGGFPAGRWRLPTEAELAFLYARQQDGSIPELFGNGKNYLSASGRYMTIDGSDVVKFTALDNLNAATANSNPSSRFVYDLWYWGDTPAAPNVYHPNGHNTTY